MFDLELMAQRQDKALTVLLALTDQEHAATQTRVLTTDSQFTTRTTSETSVRRLHRTPLPLTRPPGPASLSASELLFWTCLRGTTAETCEGLRESSGESVSTQRTRSWTCRSHGLTRRSGTRVKVG